MFPELKATSVAEMINKCKEEWAKMKLDGCMENT